ncbi:MAG TPA: hypothetical protein IAB35_05960 [Candidatus Faecimonas gallistercoris]|nr:hypothetical protein [Candidatus Faecimonas gallistercoris]
MNQKLSEEIWMRAILKWKRLHPERLYLDIKRNETIDLEGIGEVKIGSKINRLRTIYKAMQEEKHCGTFKDLTEETINWYKEQGMIWDYEKWQEEVYKKAILKWKSLHPEKDYLDIKQNETITLEGIGKVEIGNKISNMRQIYKVMQEGKHYGTYKDLTEEEMAWYKEQGMIWDYEKWQEEVYKKAILKWKRLHPEKEHLDIKQKETVNLEGIGEVKIGKKIFIMRQIYMAMQEGKHYGTYKDLTKETIKWYKEQGIIWDYEKWQKEVYKKAILKWKRLHPESLYLDIKVKETIDLEGIGEVKIGQRLNNMRKIYKAMQEGKHYGTHKDLTEEEIAWYKEHGMIWNLKEWKKQAKPKQTKPKQQKKQTQLEKYTEMFHGDIEKAERVINCLNNLRKKRQEKQKTTWNINNILKEFDVNEEKLLKQLEKTRTKGKEKGPVLMKEDEPLRKFCIDNGYNYEVISRAVKLHKILPNSNLEEIINRVIIDYNHHGQQKPSTWIYEKYGNLVKHILTNLNLDSSAILKNMTKNIVTLEEAIRHDAFLRCRKEDSNFWLEEPYNYLVEQLDSRKGKEQVTTDIIETGKTLIKDYHLTREEFSILVESFGRYANAIRRYQMYDVGLETNEERRIEKIRAYQMPEEDIEESFFMPLQFENGVLLGKQSELYQRRNLMRQYIIDWNEYSDSEKRELIKENKFTIPEVEYMENTRKEIDKTIKRTKVYRK